MLIKKLFFCPHLKEHPQYSLLGEAGTGRERGCFPTLRFGYLFGVSISSAPGSKGHHDFQGSSGAFPKGSHIRSQLLWPDIVSQGSSLLSKLFHMDGFILKGALKLSLLQTCSPLICLLLHVVVFFPCSFIFSLCDLGSFS